MFCILCHIDTTSGCKDTNIEALLSEQHITYIRNPLCEITQFTTIYTRPPTSATCLTTSRYSDGSQGPNSLITQRVVHSVNAWVFESHGLRHHGSHIHRCRLVMYQLWFGRTDMATRVIPFSGSWTGSDLTSPARLRACCWATWCASSRRYGKYNGQKPYAVWTSSKVLCYVC